jgi:hypothetical protein
MASLIGRSSGRAPRRVGALAGLAIHLSRRTDVVIRIASVIRIVAGVVTIPLAFP